MKLSEALRAVVGGEELSRECARAVFSDSLTGACDPHQLAGFLAALAVRGEARAEILGAAEALRAAARPFEHDAPDAIDTCGTGGDGLASFNVSTAAALVACAAGARVVKHGNRALSSRCGSADLLEAAGLPIEIPPAAARAVLEEVGITFLYAPLYHPALRFAAPVRRALGVRTVFNLLGPLCNPGRVRRQLLGVGDARRLADFAAVLAALGCERGYVVHGAGGADELTLAGENEVLSVGSVPEERFAPHALGFERTGVSAFTGGEPAENLRILAHVLDGAEGPIADAVVLNAAAALVVAGLASTAAEGVERARAALASGAAKRKLAAWIDCARRAVRAGDSA